MQASHTIGLSALISLIILFGDATVHNGLRRWVDHSHEVMDKTSPVDSPVLRNNKPFAQSASLNDCSWLDCAKRSIVEISDSTSSAAPKTTTVPYQSSPQLLGSFSAHSYDASFGRYKNIFERAALAETTAYAVPTVAEFGEGVARSAGSQSWGGNHVGVATVDEATAIGEEVDCVSLSQKARCYGLVLANAGTSTSKAAIQIQSNIRHGWSDGIIYNGSATTAVKDSLIKIIGSNLIARSGIDISAGKFSESEIESPSLVVKSAVQMPSSSVRIDGSDVGEPSISSFSREHPADATSLSLTSSGNGSVKLSTISGVVIRAQGSPSPSDSMIQVTSSSSGAPSISALPNGLRLRANTDLVLSGSGDGTVTMSSVLKLKAVSALDLPRCQPDRSGALSFVTNAENPKYGASIMPGGTARTLALCDGISWTVH